MMRTLILFLLASLSAQAQPLSNLIARFNYPLGSCSTTITFHWFMSSDLSIPRTNWTHVGMEQCVVGKTNYDLPVIVTPSSKWIYAGASNITGMVPFPGAAEVPPQLRSDVTVGLTPPGL